MSHCVRLCCDLCKVWLDEGDNAKRNASFHKSIPKASVPPYTHTHTSVSPAIDIQTSALCSQLSNDAVSQELGLESASQGPTHTYIHKEEREAMGTCISKKPPHNQQTLNYPTSFASRDINNTRSLAPRAPPKAIKRV